MGLIIDKELRNELKDTYIWRYMSLAKFLDLITTNSIYFATNKQLITGDPYEGTLPIFTNALFYLDSDYQSKKEEYNNITAKPLIDILKDTKSLQISQKIENIRNSTYINCWHINDDENYLMWQSYARKKGDIAIVSDIDSLIDAIDTDIDIEAIKVKYSSKDFNIEITNVSNTVNNSEEELKEIIKISSKYKKELFKNENELRLIFQVNNKDFNQKIKVDLNKLIKYIYVSPDSTETEKQTVIKLISSLRDKKETNLNIENKVFNSFISDTYAQESIQMNTEMALLGKIASKEFTEEDDLKNFIYTIIAIMINQDIPPHKREKEYKNDIKMSEIQK